MSFAMDQPLSGATMSVLLKPDASSVARSVLRYGMLYARSFHLQKLVKWKGVRELRAK